MATTIEKLLINLRVISQIQPYQKINAKSEFLLIEYYNWFASFARWVRTDDRQTCLKRLNEIITESKQILNDKDIKKEYEKRIKISLRNCIKGLENLKKTYEDDITTISYIELLIENILEFIGENIFKSESESESDSENENKKISPFM